MWFSQLSEYGLKLMKEKFIKQTFEIFKNEDVQIELAAPAPVDHDILKILKHFNFEP